MYCLCDFTIQDCGQLCQVLSFRSLLSQLNQIPLAFGECQKRAANDFGAVTKRLTALELQLEVVLVCLVVVQHRRQLFQCGVNHCHDLATGSKVVISTSQLVRDVLDSFLWRLTFQGGEDLLCALGPSHLAVSQQIRDHDLQLTQ